MDRIGMLQRTLDGASAMIHGVRADELAKPTLCSEWDVSGLVQHMLQTCQRFTAALGAGESGHAQGSAEEAKGDLAAAYDGASRRLMAAWRAPGALERTLKLPIGELPAAAGIDVVLADQLLHTWDLAKALGRPYSMDADLAEAALQMMQQMMRPEFRGPGKAFAEAVPCPDDAPVQQLLVALSGRTP